MCSSTGSAVVYAERGDEILLLRRRAGALSGQWFLPGGAVERGELPEDGARRELVEETGLDVDGELELVGAYPIWVYGGDCLQLSYRAPVRDGDVVVSDEHSAARWVDPVAMHASMSDDVIENRQGAPGGPLRPVHQRRSRPPQVWWYGLVSEHPVPGLVRLEDTISTWENELLAYFSTRATNGRTEGINRIIIQIKRLGFGFTNTTNYRLRIL
jgi:ADP-ribose pyrophosphatase YjhB (NUDIX family)